MSRCCRTNFLSSAVNSSISDFLSVSVVAMALYALKPPLLRFLWLGWAELRPWPLMA